VNEGDLLAEIETPELDQQVSQARAALEQAQANLTLAKVSFDRWRELQKTRVVARRKSMNAKAPSTLARRTWPPPRPMSSGSNKCSGSKRLPRHCRTVTKRFVEVGQLVTAI